MNSGRVAVGLVAVLLFGAVGGGFVGTVGASGTATVAATGTEAGSTTTDEVSIPVNGSSAKESGGSLTGLRGKSNNSSTGAAFDLPGIGNESIEAIGIGNSSGTINTSDDGIDSVSIKGGGTGLYVNPGGNYGISGGDYVTVRFSNATNPGGRVATVSGATATHSRFTRRSRVASTSRIPTSRASGSLSRTRPGASSRRASTRPYPPRRRTGPSKTSTPSS